MLVTLSEKCFGTIPTYKPTVLITSVALAALSGLIGFGSSILLGSLSVVNLVALAIAGVFLVSSILMLLFCKKTEENASVLSSWSNGGKKLELNMRLGNPADIIPQIIDEGIELTLDNGEIQVIKFEDIPAFKELSPAGSKDNYIKHDPKTWINNLQIEEITFLNRNGTSYIFIHFGQLPVGP
jgi:hypothetical protein